MASSPGAPQRRLWPTTSPVVPPATGCRFQRPELSTRAAACCTAACRASARSRADCAGDPSTEPSFGPAIHAASKPAGSRTEECDPARCARGRVGCGGNRGAHRNAAGRKGSWRSTGEGCCPNRRIRLPLRSSFKWEASPLPWQQLDKESESCLSRSPQDVSYPRNREIHGYDWQGR